MTLNFLKKMISLYSIYILLVVLYLVLPNLEKGIFRNVVPIVRIGIPVLFAVVFFQTQLKKIDRWTRLFEQLVAKVERILDKLLKYLR